MKFKILAVIVVLLVGVAIFSTVGLSHEDKELETRILIKQTLPMALRRYCGDIGSMPSTQQGFGALIYAPQSLNNWRGPYLSKNPIDAWGNVIYYQKDGDDGNRYRILSCGADMRKNTHDDIVYTGNYP